jgi:glycosyltransferase involved in cell wall biosynthesis
MQLSAVVPTLDARDALAACLDALAERAPAVETVVVNGPSSDGTTGMVRDRADVDVLVEVADRTVNAARNAGIDRASGDAVAFLDHRHAIASEWRDAVATGLAAADVVTGPTAPSADSEPSEPRQIAGREVSYFDPGNVAFQSTVLDELDGFDEYLDVGGARDLAHRLAGADFTLRWEAQMQTAPEVGADGGARDTDWGWKYRSLAYRLVKNYGVRPTVLRRLLAHAGADAAVELRALARGDGRPTEWLGNGRTVTRNLVGGLADGLVARRRDRTRRRNPHGRSTRADRAVAVYDWR